MKSLQHQKGVIMEIFLFILMGIAGLLLVFVLGMLLNSAVMHMTSNKVFLNNATAVVIKKEYVPAYTTTTMQMAGKVMIPITTTHPARHEVTLKEKATGISQTIDVNDDYFETIKEGDSIQIQLFEDFYKDMFFRKHQDIIMTIT